MRTISITGVKKLLNDLDKLKVEASPDIAINAKLKTFCGRLAEEGQQTAISCFATVEPENGETLRYKVNTAEWHGNTLVLSATGKDVVFLEFGTGVIHNKGNHPLSWKYGFTPTSWSRTHGKQLISPTYEKQRGKWYVFQGSDKPFEGHEPVMAMWNASKVMREKVQSIALEVFG